MDLAHYKVILSYKGSDFAGFQRQKGVRTVQGEFETGLRKLGWHENSIRSAGRTDAGVHARGQVVNFSLKWSHGLKDFHNALNYYLPEDVSVRSVQEVEPEFHPRFDARSRHYSYEIFCQPFRDPLREVFSWRVWPTLRLELIQNAALDLIGEHDFKVFGSAVTENGTTIREVFTAIWQQSDDSFRFDITANAFLYHMIRRITFVMVMIGQGQIEEDSVAKALETGVLEVTGIAPPQGLVLEEVLY